MLSKTIIERAATLVIEKGIDELEAVKQAIIEENKFIQEMIEQKTKRSIKAKETICKQT